MSRGKPRYCCAEGLYPAVQLPPPKAAAAGPPRRRTSRRVLPTSGVLTFGVCAVVADAAGR